MRLARFVRSSGLVLALVLAGFAGGCGPGPSAEPGTQVKESDEEIQRNEERRREMREAHKGRGEKADDAAKGGRGKGR